MATPHWSRRKAGSKQETAERSGVLVKGSFGMDMTHGPLAGKIMRFALPLMAANLVQLLFNAADIVVVGRFAGSASLAAVSSTTAVTVLSPRAWKQP